MPSAHFCRPVRFDRSILSPDSGTSGRSPEVSSTAFRAPPRNLRFAPLMDRGFAVIRPLAQRRMPLIRSLSIGSYVCSTLLSDPASRRRRCASLSLHLLQVVKETFTPKLSNMLGTRKKGPLGGAGLGKGGNLKLDRYLFFFFAIFFAAIIFPLLCWRFGLCVHNHYLWSRITLPLYVVVFTSYVKKNLAMKDFFRIICDRAISSARRFAIRIAISFEGKASRF
jgi:hypothetical protein